MTLSEIIDVVEECRYPDYEFSVTKDERGAIYLQASYVEANTVTGKPERQTTRRWFLSPEMTRSEIVQTCFKAILTSAEHRTREWFKFRGRPVFGPHFNVEALWHICQEGGFDERPN